MHDYFSCLSNRSAGDSLNDNIVPIKVAPEHNSHTVFLCYASCLAIGRAICLAGCLYCDCLVMHRLNVQRCQSHVNR